MHSIANILELYSRLLSCT